jgi:hypothetical protein
MIDGYFYSGVLMHLMEEPNGQPVEDFEIFKGKS